MCWLVQMHLGAVRRDLKLIFDTDTLINSTRHVCVREITLGAPRYWHGYDDL